MGETHSALRKLHTYATTKASTFFVAVFLLVDNRILIFIVSMLFLKVLNNLLRIKIN